MTRVSRRAALAGGGAAALATLLPAGDAVAQKRRRKVADLTNVFRAGFPVYVGDTARRRTIDTIAGQGFYAQEWTFGEHSGTHMDAAGHFTAGGRLTTDLRPRELIAPIAVIDVRRRAADDPDTTVGAADIRRHERRHGRIPRGAAVLMRSGWDRKAGDEAAYKNADASGTYHFPGFGADAIPPRGATLIVGVIPWEEGSGGPCRLLARY